MTNFLQTYAFVAMAVMVIDLITAHLRFYTLTQEAKDEFSRIKSEWPFSGSFFWLMISLLAALILLGRAIIWPRTVYLKIKKVFTQ